MKNKIDIELFDKKELCCGCAACVAICLQGAISMKVDEEGFLYPYIDREVCVECRRCLRVCALKE